MSRHVLVPMTAGEVAQLAIPLDGGSFLVIGIETMGLAAKTTDWELLRQAASCIGSWLAQRVAAPAASGHQPTAMPAQRIRPGTSFGRAASDGRLDVHALGSLHVERDGVPLQNWGGPKAGNHQAEAIFAILFDRGERGAPKDEIVELIWPDVPLERADLAFHRTLGGLRRTLSASGRAEPTAVISYRNDRYRLNPDLVRWTDVGEFEKQLDAAARASDPLTIRDHLEAARSLYRGDYLDDCPYYGDSSGVEARRQLLRGRHTDVLIGLGISHELRGNDTAAAGFFREALAENGNQCTLAEQGLIRMQAIGSAGTDVVGDQRQPRRRPHRFQEVAAAG